MLKNFAAKQLITYLNSNPDENIPKLVNWVEKYLPEAYNDPKYAYIKDAALNKDSNWYQLIESIWTDIDKDVRQTILVNFFVNGYLEWNKKRPALMEKYGCSIPWTILMDPTSGCNLKCIGCWASEYGNKLNLDFDTLNSIVEQAKELGIHVFLFSGGEPLVAKKRIIQLCEAHPDCVFASFTNGTLIDEDFAKEMLRVKNFIPTISVEGFEEATDGRRGEGTFARIEKAMDILNKYKLPFGASCCYTSANVDSLSSEAYFDWLVEKGAKYAWFFTFMPIGVDSTTDLMVTPEQRELMYYKIREYRKTKPLFTIDFWNDGEYVRGCIAGGRNYLHINANGDVEPCAFIHYSNVNIKEHSLIECLQSDLFKQYQAGQPFNDNYLKPCPLLDNPGKLQEMVHASHAKSTDMEAPENVDDLGAKTKEAAEKWSPTADRLWAENRKAKAERDAEKEKMMNK
jgi:MoaA/NifB/PqqE/SkfB family radical SAM enzyme